VRRSHLFLVAVCLLASGALLTGQTRPAGPAGAPCTTAPAAGRCSATRHEVRVAGRWLRYTAVAGLLDVRDEAGNVQAEMFYVAYTLDGAAAASRPITFAFNGGPGSASLWLHLGAMGPRRVVLGPDGKAPPGRVRRVDNEDTWLTFTDLVFIDPVGTGYSRGGPGVPTRSFFNTDKDVDSIAGFIRTYVSRNGRWASPKFMAGESYGTTRIAGVVRRLQKRDGMYFNGLVMLSSALNFQTFIHAPGNDLPYMVNLPGYTAVAWYHRKLPADLQKDLAKTLRQAERFAIETYGPALAAGDALPPARRKEIVQALHRYTGLPEAVIDHRDLRIPVYVFAAELLRADGQVVGVLDGRVAGPAMRPGACMAAYDPAMALVAGPFTAAMQDYLRSELNFRIDRRYVYLSSAANRSWDWGCAGFGGGYVNMMDDLRRAMTENTRLRVLSVMGSFDLTTPYFGQVYVLRHLGLAPPLRANIRAVRYPAGHQVYNQDASRKRFSEDAAAFIRQGEAPSGPDGQSTSGRR